MWEEYELTLNHAKELRNPNLTDLADMKRRIQELKMRSVNLVMSMSMRSKNIKMYPSDIIPERPA